MQRGLALAKLGRGSFQIKTIDDRNVGSVMAEQDGNPVDLSKHPTRQQFCSCRRAKIKSILNRLAFFWRLKIEGPTLQRLEPLRDQTQWH